MKKIIRTFNVLSTLYTAFEIGKCVKTICEKPKVKQLINKAKDKLSNLKEKRKDNHINNAPDKIETPTN